MGRILAIDYGLKRTGLAVTDPLKIIASPLDTITTEKFFEWFADYNKEDVVETIVVGLPTKLDQSDTHITGPVRAFVDKLKEEVPNIQIHLIDERYTSKMAQQAMLRGGMKKKDRRKKENVDKISATIILQSFLDSSR